MRAMKASVVLAVAACCIQSAFSARVDIDIGEPGGTLVRVDPQETDADDETTPTPTPPPEPVCCARLQGTRRGPNPIVEFKLKGPGKYCHAKSWGTNWPETVGMACCEGLAYGKTRKTEDSRCLANGYDCSEYNAVKSGPYECQCDNSDQDKVCVQTIEPPEWERERHGVAQYKTECEDGKFSSREQILYGFTCMSEDWLLSGEESCSKFDAVEGARGNTDCKCASNDVCIGKPCVDIGAGKFGFLLADAYISGAGKLKDWQVTELEKIDVRFEVGCVTMGCDMFKAVGSPDSCYCEPRKFKYGSVARYPKTDAKTVTRFHVQEGWDKGYLCREDAGPRCPDGEFNTVGLFDYDDDEPYCDCSYNSRKRKHNTCEGPHCVQPEAGGPWYYPAFKQNENHCSQ